MQAPTDPTELLEHADSLRRFVRSLLHDEASSDDVVQETWTRAIRNPAAAAAAPRAWLFAVARNVVRERHRAATRRAARERLAARPEADECDPSEVAARVEALQRVTRAVLDLEEPYRSTLLLRFFDDETPERIAAQAGVPAATVRTRVRRGLGQVRERLDREAGDWRAALAPFVAVVESLPPPAPPVRWGRTAVAACLLFAFGAWVLPHLVWPFVGPSDEMADAPSIGVSSAAADETPPASDAAPAEPVEDATALADPATPPPAPTSTDAAVVPQPAPAEVAPAERAAEPAVAAQGPPDFDDTVVAGDPDVLRSVGSDSMNNLMTYWAQAMVRARPTLKFTIEGKGSTTAAPALLERTADLGPMSRPMKDAEIAAFVDRRRPPPAKARVAMDALAVFVHRDNPVQGLSLTQVDSVFSSTRKRGGSDVTTWGQLGLTGDWADKPIHIYGRNSASGTYGYFKEHVLRKGDFRNTVKEQPGSAGVVQGVSEDKYAIGYSGIGYATSLVRAVPLAEKDGAPFVAGRVEQVRDGSYPLGRSFLVYFDGARAALPDDPVRAFLSHVLSDAGQESVTKDGYLPLSAAQISAERAALGLDR